MFLNFFNQLREAKVPVTLKEYLMLMEAMDEKVIDMDVEDFYYLSRAALVKDERNIDKFDKVFSHVFKGLDSLADAVDVQDIPEGWLRKMTEKFHTKEEMDEIEAMGAAYGYALTKVGVVSPPPHVVRNLHLAEGDQVAFRHSRDAALAAARRMGHVALIEAAEQLG